MTESGSPCLSLLRKKKKNQSRADSNTRSNCLTARNAEECSKLPGAAIRESEIQPVGNSKNSSGRMTQFLQQTEYREEKRWRGHLQIKRDLKDIFKNKAKLNCNVQGCILGNRVKKWLRSSLGKLLLLGPGGHGTGRVSGWTSGWRPGFQLWTWVVYQGACLLVIHDTVLFFFGRFVYVLYKTTVTKSINKNQN